jgi:hypothetical protein
MQFYHAIKTDEVFGTHSWLCWSKPTDADDVENIFPQCSSLAIADGL